MKGWLFPFALLGLLAPIVAGQTQKRVTIELKDVPVAEAFVQLFRSAGVNYLLVSPKAYPMKRRVTLRLVDLPFEKALVFLCELTGLAWKKEGDVYVIRRRPLPLLVPPFPGVQGAFPRPLPKEAKEQLQKTLVEIREAVKEGVRKVLRELEVQGPKLLEGFAVAPSLMLLPSKKRFRCPKCGSFIPLERFQCPQCRRFMRSGWRFCPYDGKKLPPAFKGCPKCGDTLKQ